MTDHFIRLFEPLAGIQHPLGTYDSHFPAGEHRCAAFLNAGLINPSDSARENLFGILDPSTKVFVITQVGVRIFP